MSSRNWLRAAAACGAAYPLLLILGDDVIAAGDEVAPDAGTPEQVAAALAAKASPEYFYGRGIGLLSVVCLVVFAAYVASRLRVNRGPASIWPTLAAGGGVLAGAMLLQAAVPQLALVDHAGAGADPLLLMMLLDFQASFLIAMLPIALVVASVAVAGWHGEVVGRAVARVGAVLAVLLVVGFIFMVGGQDLAFLPMALSWLWFIAAGVSAVRRVPASVDIAVGVTGAGR
ncbi:hypothetical protein [Nocardioides limicola]|uniref:hypothetical protein n=1 Tax=Nocardioides limicola TaxID=2803368 RepID=UPI00193B12A2|nr:hypothetical protein [Nocardioides sp. DJM-14]